jgi:hypothetical protein
MTATSSGSQERFWPSPTSQPRPDDGGGARLDLDPNSGLGRRKLLQWQHRRVEPAAVSTRGRVRALSWPAGGRPAGVDDQQTATGLHLNRSRIERQRGAAADVITTQIMLQRAVGSSSRLPLWSVADQTPTSNVIIVDAVSINGVNAGSTPAPRRVPANVPVEACTLVHVLTPRHPRNVDN